MIIRKRFLAVMLAGAMAASLTACNGGGQAQQPSTETQTPQEVTYRTDVTCAKLEEAVAQALGDNYYPQENMPSVEDLGITADMYTDFVYSVPMISVNVDTLIIVKAAEGKADDVKAALDAYRDMNINNSMQYPMNISKVQNSIVEQFGDYVAFIQLGAGVGNDASYDAYEKDNTLSDDALAAIEAEAITQQNELAASVIEAELTAK